MKERPPSLEKNSRLFLIIKVKAPLITHQMRSVCEVLRSLKVVERGERVSNFFYFCIIRLVFNIDHRGEISRCL